MFQKGANLAAMLEVSRYNDPVHYNSRTAPAFLSKSAIQTWHTLLCNPGKSQIAGLLQSEVTEQSL